MSAAYTDTTLAGADDSARGLIIAGVVIMVLFFLGLGSWAALAPLNSAALATATIKVEGNRKSVQHLEGGLVRELRVKEGDQVTTGQVMLVLDDTQARAVVEVLSKQYLELRAQEARLIAEQNRAQSFSVPDELLARRNEPEVARIIAGQSALFSSRRVALAGQIGLTQQKIAQTKEEIKGQEAQYTAQKLQNESLQAELIGLRDLFKKGYVTRQRMLELERSAAAFEGQVAETAASIMRSRQSIEEQNLQAIQLQSDRSAQVASDLRDAQVKLLATAPQLEAARDTLRRTELRAPYSGYVVGLTVFSVGGVVKAGETLMDIVPHLGGLIVEATITVDDVKDVHPGMPAEVRLTAYKQRSVPTVAGKVVQVSADRLTDTRTGEGYYLAQIKVDEHELASMKDIRLAPGMPALVMIPTGERTALDYLLRPVLDSFKKAFREK
jgi:membrane fusion protein, type I secretion system